MVVENRLNGNGMVLSETTYRRISRILYELNTRLRATLTIFADMNGYPIDYSGDPKNINVNALTAVAAGSFSASNEMSRMISGEQNFDHVLHEGSRRNVYMCNVSNDYIMILVFGKAVPIGFVRLLTHTAVGKLNQYLDSLKMQSRHISQFIDADFRSKLNRELDQAFGF
ncbi:roadblock/LC7 domain-containing protein [candidate division KSB1 bacterium]|nr:roadblock/LC7 domain-containing protein [candidate division KSB1 bacterium]